MGTTMPNKLEQRIRARAHQLWEEEGRPEGRSHAHWEKARILVAIEDDKTSLKPVGPTAPEPAEVMENLGEFPTGLTDEGDRQQFPSRRGKRPSAPKKAAATGTARKPSRRVAKKS